MSSGALSACGGTESETSQRPFEDSKSEGRRWLGAPLYLEHGNICNFINTLLKLKEGWRAVFLKKKKALLKNESNSFKRYEKDSYVWASLKIVKNGNGIIATGRNPKFRSGLLAHCCLPGVDIGGGGWQGVGARRPKFKGAETTEQAERAAQVSQVCDR